MITLHAVYVVTLVSQATSASVLFLLAWADRRSRWLLPLATACALHAIAIYLMPLWRGTGRWLPQALSSSVLIGMVYLIHLGLQSLITPRQRRSARVHAVIVTLMLVVFALAPLKQLWSLQTACIVAICVLAWTVRILWKARLRELRVPLRATALLLLAVLVIFLIRLPLEGMVPAPPLLLTLRKTTILLITSMAFSFLAIYVAETKRRLDQESRLDALTGLPNRRAMEEKAARLVQLAARRERPCGLLMMDLDNFKQLNDAWGHGMGDKALRATGDILLAAAQGSSRWVVARMGGEEFAMLLSGCSVNTAHALAERLRAEVAALRLNDGDRTLSFSVSIGVGALHTGETTWTEMLRRADVALYRAKREGRNRVVLCTEAALQKAAGEIKTGKLKASEKRHAAAKPEGADRGDHRHRAAPARPATAVERESREATERTSSSEMLR